MAGVDDNIVRENEQFLVDGTNDLREGASREIGAANAALKQGVAGEKSGGNGQDFTPGYMLVCMLGGSAFDDHADAAGRMTGCVQDTCPSKPPQRSVSPSFKKSRICTVSGVGMPSHCAWTSRAL